MLELAGRYADIVGLHARMDDGRIDRAAVADLTAAAFIAKIAHARDAAAAVGRPDPRFQVNCYYVDVTDAAGRSGFRSSWAAALESQLDLLADSPTVLVGTAAECAQRILRYHEQLGISYWHFGQNIDAASQIIERIR